MDTQCHKYYLIIKSNLIEKLNYKLEDFLNTPDDSNIGFFRRS